MFKGLRTVIYPAPNLKKAKEWYSVALGEQPYFDEEFYVGFDIGGYELGLQPERTPGTAGSIVYWGVIDIQETWNKLIELGATADEKIMHVGGNVYVATVVDPFGNLFGIIQNPNFEAKE
ncbi:bleomycin resistance protein [Balneola sp. EhC07]|uniref:VOC family protein n=1 Tax=Balneola sp. EhC07 TaxID=1849360 RepID=UPI0007F518C7|nr:glyoxalase/bleomycin resistance/extradiol dioxygenase family protein [Balneola sp. EhC07]OAN61384.1 bleomycin resistance protein [Balneola sp. EhC07]